MAAATTRPRIGCTSNRRQRHETDSATAADWRDLSFGSSGASPCARMRRGTHCCVAGFSRDRTCFIGICQQELTAEGPGAARLGSRCARQGSSRRVVLCRASDPQPFGPTDGIGLQQRRQGSRHWGRCNRYTDGRSGGLCGCRLCSPRRTRLRSALAGREASRALARYSRRSCLRHPWQHCPARSPYRGCEAWRYCCGDRPGLVGPTHRANFESRGLPRPGDGHPTEPRRTGRAFGRRCDCGFIIAVP